MSKRILFIIILSQAFCTSLWFAGNAVLGDVGSVFKVDKGYLAHLTSAIQFGFITGTFVFALLAVADRFSPSKVFFASAIMASLINLAICLPQISSWQLLLFRFVTGFFLAGIYPVGMKIASDHFGAKLGQALGFLVGALVLGTAFPHFLKSSFFDLPWQYVVYGTTALSLTGGVLILILVPDGPFRKKGNEFKLNTFLNGFKRIDFRSAAFGYFGHMWELYTFWAFVPLMIIAYNNRFPLSALPVSQFSFAVIASGGVACAFTGVASRRWGAKKLAVICLALSCLCCLLSPLFLFSASVIVFAVFLLFWGMVVVGDSPLFSTLVAQSAPEASRGSSLTIVNCIGFGITIISMQIINLIAPLFSEKYIYIFLAIGPALGLLALRKTPNNN